MSKSAAGTSDAPGRNVKAKSGLPCCLIVIAITLYGGYYLYSLYTKQIEEKRINQLIDMAIKSRLQNAMGGWCTQLSELYGMTLAMINESGPTIDEEKLQILNKHSPRLKISYELIKNGWTQKDFNRLETFCLDDLYQRKMFRTNDYEISRHEAGHLLMHSLIDSSHLNLSASINPRIGAEYYSDAHVTSSITNISFPDEKTKYLISMLVLLAGKAATDGLWTEFTEKRQSVNQCDYLTDINCDDISAWHHYAKRYLQCEAKCENELDKLYHDQVHWLKDVMSKHKNKLDSITETLLHYREIDSTKVRKILHDVNIQLPNALEMRE
jgi:hypothetical protein